MNTQLVLPEELSFLKARLSKELQDLKPVSKNKLANLSSHFNTDRTFAGRALRQYYLYYFLLVEFLEYEDLGQFEKVSFSIPIEYKGQLFFLEHRKLGLGLVTEKPKEKEQTAEEVVHKLNAALEMAKPFFEWKAEQAAEQSKLNVVNHSNFLFDRYRYFSALYSSLIEDAEHRKGEKIEEEIGGWTHISYPSTEIKQNAEWVSMSAIDAFFSWTEHVFIHMAILRGKTITGKDVDKLASGNWANKFKAALDVSDKETHTFYEQLTTIKRQLRNYITHGAFGKNGEAMSFHSNVGAVPLLLPQKQGAARFTFYSDLSFDEDEVLNLIEKFIVHLWSGPRMPFKVYIQSSLPSILTMAQDGQYPSAIESLQEMEELVEYLQHRFDVAANMDW